MSCAQTEDAPLAHSMLGAQSQDVRTRGCPPPGQQGLVRALAQRMAPAASAPRRQTKRARMRLSVVRHLTSVKTVWKVAAFSIGAWAFGCAAPEVQRRGSDLVPKHPATAAPDVSLYASGDAAALGKVRLGTALAQGRNARPSRHGPGAGEA